MSRSGYVDEDDGDCRINLWRGSVERAIRGKRGQAFLIELAAALDAMPVRELIAGDLVEETGHVCAIGAVAVARKMDVSELDPYDGEDVGAAFGVARSMACEIAYENDERGPSSETRAQRWARMRAWVGSQIVT